MKSSKGSYWDVVLARILPALNTQLPETRPLPLSLREILASKGIAPSYENVQKRLEMFKGETSTPVPGIEVTYLELDPNLWEQVVAV